MPTENKYVIDLLKLEEKESLEDFFQLYYNKLFGKEIYLIQSHVGMINAAIATVLGINKAKPYLVIKIGCVGANSQGIKRNSLLVPTQFFHSGAWATRSNVENMPTYDSSKWESLFGDKPYQINNGNLGGIPYTFKPSGKYIRKYKAVLKKMNKNFFEASLGSGDMVIFDKKFMHNIQSNIVGKGKLWCSDNESYSIAQVCYITNTPFFGIYFVASSDYDDKDNYDPESISYQTKNTIVPIVEEFIKEV